MAVKTDKVLSAAVETAREAALLVAEADAVGDHLGVEMEADRVATHSFACNSPGYPGWRWAVTLTRIPRARSATVSEVHLLPGEGALLAPEWVPYAQRLAPGDIGPGDATPYVEDDPHLEAGFEATGEEEVDQMAFFELGLGRPRVLSAEGREVAATRWFEGEHGPHTETARKAPKPCSSCGYFVPMAGALRAVFGVCANEWSTADGSVVALGFGCGAHSEVDVERREPERVEPPVLDDASEIEFVQR